MFWLFLAELSLDEFLVFFLLFFLEAFFIFPVDFDSNVSLL